MLPHVLQPRNYGAPVAALTIDGLVISSFNQESRNWESAFLRGAHNFLIHVKEVDLLTGEIVRESAPTPVRETDLIKFVVNGGSERHFQDFSQGYFKTKPEFIRLQEDDSYDYRWVVDVTSEIPHGEFVDLKRPADDRVTIVTVPNALFYTKRVTQDSVVFTLEGSDPTVASDPNRFVLGRTNELIGAVLYAEAPGGIEINYVDTGEPVVDFPMPYDAGFFYDISMMNMDLGGENGEGEHAGAGAYVEGDFNQVYKLFDFSTEHKFQIFAPIPPDSLEDNRTLDGDCHGTGSGGGGGLAPHSLLGLIGG